MEFISRLLWELFLKELLLLAAMVVLRGIRHMAAAVVAQEGAQVRAGETVALVGSTGDSTGNHVHIQVSADGMVYNPAGTVPLTAYA